MSGAGEASGRTLSGGFEIALNLSDRRQMKVSGYIYSDDTAADINARVDGLQDQLDRQAIRADVQNKEAQVEQHRVNLVMMKNGLEDLLGKKEREGKLSSQEGIQLKNMPTTIRQANEMIASLEAAIAAGKQKLGMAQ